LGAAGDLVCVRCDNGEIRWQKNIVDEFGGAIPNWGFCESVLFDQGRLIITPGGDSAAMVALEPETGEVLWKTVVTERSRAGYASAAVGEFAGVRQYIQFVADGTIGVRADNGQFLWRENTAANSSANCCSPLVSGKFVFSASGYGTGGALVRLTEGGSRAELVYHTRDMCCHHGDMVIVDGLLFGSHDPGVLTCLDLLTGDVKWKDRSVGKGAVTCADGRIYLRSEQGSVALIEAIADGYRELGRFEQSHRSSSSAWAHPVVAAKRLFLRDQDVLLCYDLAVTP
jgi:outer membrane protein assembly factor BamB